MLKSASLYQRQPVGERFAEPAMPSQDPSGQQGYIIEFHRIGNAVKVSAMDPRTLTEVSMIGAPGAGDAELTRLVVRKLEFMLAKKARPAPGGDRPTGRNR